MGKIVAIAVIAVAVWFTYSESAQENFKKKALSIMGQEKTINAVNVRRNNAQSEIDGVLDR